MDELRFPVVIVGAGPTGLALGTELKRLGIEALILDKHLAGLNTSRAIAIHARTLEVLEPMGVSPSLLEAGLPISTFVFRDQDQILAKISFKALKTAYPFVLACPQDRTEAILLNRLESLGGKVQRPCEVVDIHPKHDHVQIKYKINDTIKTVKTEWLVGCDGIHSKVREQASIPFIGGHYQENFVLADVEMDWSLGYHPEGNLFLSKKGLLLVAPLPNQRFRIIATLKQEKTTALTIDDFLNILKERGPEKGNIHIGEMFWSSSFHIQHRIAKTFWKGRILLAGDAAHVHSPAGGQGMNTGIQEAITLAHALDNILKNKTNSIYNENKSYEPLKTWEKKRLKIAHSIVKLSDEMTRIGTLSSPVAQYFRNFILRVMGKFPFIVNNIAKKLSELDNK